MFPASEFFIRKEHAMSSPQSDKIFGSSVAKFYDEYIVPLFFEPYALKISQDDWLRAG
jgi:hypothetical protein